MILRHGLSRQILLSMAAVTLAAALLVFFGFYISFALLVTFFPKSVYEDTLLPTGTDFVILSIFSLLALLVAGVIALKLAARILAPLNSLAESARRIANGDLTARATPGDRSLGETAQLVADFNTMAQRLQDMADNMKTWNAAVAHELRTPLTILRGRLQGIADGVFESEPVLIRNLILQVDGLSRLVEDLRVVTLADSGRLELKVEPVRLVDHIHGVAALMEPSLSEAGFSLELSLADVVVDADGARIRQALVALLDNAQRHASPGRILIATARADDRVILSVEDEGPGLTDEFAKHAFQPFTRADTSRSRTLTGSGLGLAVVRAVAEAHGGTVTYQASSRRGARFEIVLAASRTYAN